MIRKITNTFFNNITETFIYIFSPYKRQLINYMGERRRLIFKFVMRIRRQRRVGSLMPNEAYQLYTAVLNTNKIKGDIAEVGVYKGGSARIICEVKRNKKLYLFDTFEGLPEVDAIDTLFKKGEFCSSIKEVKEYLKEFKNVYFFKGFFPQTSTPIKNNTFSLVHLDVDIYKSTLDSLKFFYPRMEKGGIIISHDYINSAGVTEAFDEFFKKKKEPLIELSGSQVMVVKL